jgi:lysozyme
VDYSQEGLHLTERFEGCKLKAYQDQVGVWTIGFGHTDGVEPGDTCTYDEARQYLQEDLQAVVDQINQDVRVTLTQGEFDALVDFGFNLGLHALETSTLWKLLNQGDFIHAALQFPLWDHAGGKEVAGLLRRRMEEQALFNRCT